MAQKNDVARILRHYYPIKQKIGTKPQKNLAELMIKLLKSPDYHDEFIKNPKQIFKREGIKIDVTDTKMFIDLLKYLKSRLVGGALDHGAIMATIPQKATDEGMQYNFDNSVKSNVKFENAIAHTRGNQSEKTMGEDRSMDESFEKGTVAETGSGVNGDGSTAHQGVNGNESDSHTDKTVDGENILHNVFDDLRNDIYKIFFPGQPLVSPQLVEKIKKRRE